MTDQAKDLFLAHFNGLRIWVEAPGQRTLLETVNKMDRDAMQIDCTLHTPLNTELTICLKLGSRKKEPFEEDFAFEISLDGRPIHPVFIRNTTIVPFRVHRYFALDGRTHSEYTFHVGRVTVDDTLPPGPIPAEWGQLRIDVFSSDELTERLGAPQPVAGDPSNPARKKKGTAHKSKLSDIKEIKANSASLKPDTICFQSSRAMPCKEKERNINWGPPGETYRSPEDEPLVTLIYNCRASLDSSSMITPTAALAAAGAKTLAAEMAQLKRMAAATHVATVHMRKDVNDLLVTAESIDPGLYSGRAGSVSRGVKRERSDDDDDGPSAGSTEAYSVGNPSAGEDVEDTQLREYSPALEAEV